MGDPIHMTMYALMGIGALTLTATQPMLAWQLWRHPDPRKPVALRLAILIGLVSTFMLGAGSGIPLASLQPSSGGATVPLFGWSLGGGALRPAHFVGIHAEQILPLAGYAIVARGGRHPRLGVWLATIAHGVVFAALVVRGWPHRP